jgi:hypothetical protein
MYALVLAAAAVFSRCDDAQSLLSSLHCDDDDDNDDVLEHRDE